MMKTILLITLLAIPRQASAGCFFGIFCSYHHHYHVHRHHMRHIRPRHTKTIIVHKTIVEHDIKPIPQVTQPHIDTTPISPIK